MIIVLLNTSTITSTVRLRLTMIHTYNIGTLEPMNNKHAFPSNEQDNTISNINIQWKYGGAPICVPENSTQNLFFHRHSCYKP